MKDYQTVTFILSLLIFVEVNQHTSRKAHISYKNLLQMRYPLPNNTIFSMFKTQTKRNQSLHKTNFNELQKYLLSKSKHHKIYVMRHTYHSPKKQIDRSSDYFLGERPQIKKVLPFQQNIERTDVPQMDLPLEKQSSQYANDQESQKHKRLKSNKTLLNLLLNHFHQEHIKNETFHDSDTSSRHDHTSHTASLHKYTKNGRNHPINIKQSNKKPLEGLPAFASFYSKGAQKVVNIQINPKERKSNFYQSFPEVNKSQEKKRNDKTIHNIFNECNTNDQRPLNPHRSDNFLHRTRRHELKIINKQNKLQRSSQKCYKLSTRQKGNNNEEHLSNLNPWSTTMINDQGADL